MRKIDDSEIDQFGVEPVYECVGYNVQGKKIRCKYEDDINKNKNLAAKEVTELLTGRVTYLIRTNFDGGVYDPNALISTVRYSLGGNNWKLKPVSKNIFDAYIKYLDTGNKFYLVRIQREVLNG